MERLETNGFSRATILLAVTVICLVGLAMYAVGVPQGASISNNVTDTGPTAVAGNRSDAGGTITTMDLTSIQQNANWKAYVGNVSGSLTLDDANSNTIYDWTLTTIAGEVYASRDNNVNWATIICAVTASITAEQTIMGGTDADVDSINRTFNATSHAAMQVGVNSISADSCKSAYMFMNDTRQSDASNNNFTNILLEDPDNDIIYATFIENNDLGFDEETYDFQMIVPENTSVNTYYFYLELGS